MNDNQVIKVLYSILRAGLTEYGFPLVALKQSNQPTQQGVNRLPTVYFFKVSDRRYGFLKSEDKWNADTQVMVHTESQTYESIFQLSALAIQDPKDTDSITASDLVSYAASILQSDLTVQALLAEGIGILRITDIRNPYFKDDRDQFEASPSFDFTLVYDRTRVTQSPVLESFDVGTYPV